MSLSVKMGLAAGVKGNQYRGVLRPFPALPQAEGREGDLEGPSKEENRLQKRLKRQKALISTVNL